jgi:hypothetical protein
MWCTDVDGYYHLDMGANNAARALLRLTSVQVLNCKARRFCAEVCLFVCLFACGDNGLCPRG